MVMDPASPPPVEWLRDVSPARWVAERLSPFGESVGSVIPAGFEAYARVFHPLGSHSERAPDRPTERWSSVAARNGRIAHPCMQFHRIACPPGSSGDVGMSDISVGSLPLPERAVLVELLARSAPSAPLCWFCMWDGYGNLDHRGVSERVELPGRRYYLYRGPLGTALSWLPTASPPPRARSVDYSREVVERWRRSASPPPSSLLRWPVSRRSPNLWWPDDRSWFVATEIDFGSTYVGGGRELIGRVLAHPALEALPARSSDDPGHDADRLNL
jgi:hypothetical protein